MKIHNVRFGLATNSSSSHSLIFLDEGQSPPDSLLNGYEFGWQNFVAHSEESKRAYLGILLYNSLDRRLSNPAVALALVKEWAGIDLSDPLNGGLVGYIDHQSHITLPEDRKSAVADFKFFTALKKFVLQDNVAILGGNDNDEDDHPLLSEGTEVLPQIERESYSSSVCRYDDRYDYWSIFNQETGAKLRMSFDNTETPTKASAPELVDLKITSFCPFIEKECYKWCYQGSGTDGKHASRERLRDILQVLGDWEVFEVAIGGGEPTFHPDFLWILETARAHGIVPNFTTNNLNWLSKPKTWVPIMDNCGAFAHSVTNGAEVKELGALIENNGIDPKQVCVQHVIGTSPKHELANILRTAEIFDFRITLLGYKTTGRGTKPDFNEKDWLPLVQELRDQRLYPKVSVDTTLAEKQEEDIKAAGIPEWMYHTKEGTFSMYIDAVDNKVGASSYTTDLLPIKKGRYSAVNSEVLLAQFGTF